MDTLLIAITIFCTQAPDKHGAKHIAFCINKVYTCIENRDRKEEFASNSYVRCTMEYKP